MNFLAATRSSPRAWMAGLYCRPICRTRVVCNVTVDCRSCRGRLRELFEPVKRQSDRAREAFDRQRFPFTKRYFRCARSRFSRGAPTPRNSKTSQSRRSRMARSWCARWRSASAAPTARSSPATMARRRPAASGWCSATSRSARCSRRRPAAASRAGDRVVGIVRRPDPVPCPACAAGEWDMCRNGRYTERGIKGLHGFGSERFRIEPSFADQGRSRARRARRAAGADQHRRQGLGPHRAHRPAFALLGAAAAAGHRRRPDRPAGGADGQAARATRCTCSTAPTTGRSRRWSRDLGATLSRRRDRRHRRASRPTS